MDKEQQIDALLPHLDEWMSRVLGGWPETADKAYAAAKVARRGLQKIAREALDEPDKAIAAANFEKAWHDMQSLTMFLDYVNHTVTENLVMSPYWERYRKLLP